MTRIILETDDEGAVELFGRFIECSFGTLTSRLDDIEQLIHKEFKGVKHLMNQETTAILSRIDAASTELAADIQAIIDRANQQGSLTAAEINAALEPKVAFLEALARDTNAPVPPVPPPTETPAP